MKVSELVQKLGDSVASSSLPIAPTCDPEITGIAAVNEAIPGTLSYVEGGKFATYVGTTAASALILPLNEDLQAQAIARGIAWIATTQPRLVFAQALKLFYQPFRPESAIHPSAVIHPSVQIGESVYIGPRVVIQAGVKIGNGVCIHSNVVIYPEVQIGDRTVLHANCVIHERAQLGADCVIHSGAAIGAEGFGFVPSPEGWFKMEQSGYTLLEDGVEVGCNSTIDRAAVGETRIRRNTKIDNLVHIGHGCRVGDNCAVAAQVGIAGSVEIGNRVVLSGQVGIANQVRVGDDAIITAKTGIHSDVESGALVSGIPAVPHKTFLRISAVYKRIPEMYSVFKQIQSKVLSAKD